MEAADARANRHNWHGHVHALYSALLALVVKDHHVLGNEMQTRTAGCL